MWPSIVLAAARLQGFQFGVGFFFLKAGWDLPEQVGEDLSQCSLFFYFMSDFKKTDNESGGFFFPLGICVEHV